MLASLYLRRATVLSFIRRVRGRNFTEPIRVQTCRVANIHLYWWRCKLMPPHKFTESAIRHSKMMYFISVAYCF